MLPKKIYILSQNGSALITENRTRKGENSILFNCRYGEVKLNAIRKIFCAIA